MPIFSSHSIQFDNKIIPLIFLLWLKNSNFWLTLAFVLLLPVIVTRIWLWEAPSPPIDTFLELRQTLTVTGVNAKQRFDGLYNNLTRLESITGWRGTTVKLLADDIMVALERTNGSIKQLKEWAAENGFIHRVDQSSVVLLSRTPNMPVLAEDVLMDVGDVTGYLADALYKFLPEMDLMVNEEISHGSYLERRITVALKNHSRNDLVDLGTVIEGLPVSFVDGELNLDEGLITGELHLIILGE